ncbi:hypothetical protein Clacol_002927 [Clathrus columnatus]|uniref:very-long-chain enoyl-CoA reductase n=1 Tax=Clathrus columnatus TaxID=1419009 RepID=A0AAV5A659_9AGAM|nr:hypothetical protein Clacol_002927 [Clathrus columnatus]
MTKITISYRGRTPSIATGLPITLDVDQNATIEQVKRDIAKKLPKFLAERQKLSLKKDKANKALDDQATLISLGVDSNEELVVKDLGPQISWKTVFLVEYVGPLLIHPIFYYFPKFIYGRNFEHSQLQKLIYLMIILHFVKRELETLFSAHYHIGSGLAIAWGVYGPSYSAPSLKNTWQDDPKILQLAFGVWAVAELLNLHSHITLRNLRPAGTKVRAIPKGLGFNLVSCPNYLWEIVGWAVISAITNSIYAHVFTILSAAQMLTWALKKHRNYKHEFGKEYPKNRKAMFPFLI